VRFEGFENYLNGIDIIYWINLDRSPDRRENMEKMFKDDVFSGIPNERITGIDGLTINMKDKFEEYDSKKPPGVYGCLLSHFETIRKFNNSNYDIALIMEDDITLEFKKYWKKNIREIIENAPNDWEIILLCYIAGDEHVLWNWNSMKGDYTKNHTSSTGSYIINKKGSNKLIKSVYNEPKQMYKLNLDISPHSDRYIYMSLNTYAYKYPMFIYKTDNDSLIGHDIDDHNRCKKRVIEQYNYFIN
jgi:GR25 family glycosyltransferase involved in LPS biosynthesis